MKAKLRAGDALLIVDPQNDFLPGGALPVPQGDEIIPILNTWIKAAQEAKIPIIVSRDWHPANHISFKEQGGHWPAHCVQNTWGAEFSKDLKIPKDVIIINKAFHADKEAYSAFEGVTDKEAKPLTEQLSELKVTRIWIAGLALDYCVHYSAVNAFKEGFEFHVILPACRSISKHTEDKAMRDLEKFQAVFEYDAEPYVK
jgi:nicotinamidase/pyrazinamidase